MNLDNHIIWMCWFQGIDNLMNDTKNSICYNSWLKNSHHKNFILLHDDNIKEYAPEYYDIINNSPYRRIQAKSDLLRLILLEKYGGTWTDASVYCNQKFEEIFFNTVNETNFFTYRFVPRSITDKGNKETTSWYITNNNPNDHLIKSWKNLFISKYTNHDYEWKLFTIHNTLCELYDTDDAIKSTINNMVQINENIPHSANKGRSCEYSFLYKRPNIFHLKLFENREKFFND
jgi:hypothetical protein